MVDELDTTTTNDDDALDLDEHEEKDTEEDIDPSKLIDEPLDEVEEVEDLAVEEAAVSPEEDPFGFGAFGQLDENGEFVATTTEDEEEDEDEISEDLF